MTQKVDVKDLPDDIWLVRDCVIYKEEYDICISKSGRKHQKYTLGFEFDCSKWKEDYENCIRFEDNDDIDAVKKVIVNEKERHFKRIKASINNNVWEYRTSPPEDWNKPIPGWEDKPSIFKAYELGKEIPQPKRSCTIL